MWSPADLHVVKGLDVMRRRPEMYMPEGVSAPHIAARLVSSAQELGATHVRVDTHASWSIVSADIDWLLQPPDLNVPIGELFQRLVVLKGGGPNAARAEAWVGAYCRAAVAVTPKETIQVVGTETLPVGIQHCLVPLGCVRSVAFRLT